MDAVKGVTGWVLVGMLACATGPAQSLPVGAETRVDGALPSAAERADLRLRLMRAEDRARASEAQVTDLTLRLDHLEELVSSMSNAMAIRPVPQIEFADGKHMMLLEPMAYQVGDSGIEVTVPAGFVHDNASVPQPLWALLPPHGAYGRAAIVHDYLYWAQPCGTRKQADNLLMLAMLESQVGLAARTAVYRGVRLGGGGPYRANRRSRAQGGIRVVPADRRDIPASATWPDYQSQLQADGVRDPAFPPDTGFCALGDRVEVPDVQAAE